MSNDLMLKTYFIMAFKIGLKSDLRMKWEEASHLAQERKHLRIVLPGDVSSFFYGVLGSAPCRPVRRYGLCLSLSISFELSAFNYPMTR